MSYSVDTATGGPYTHEIDAIRDERHRAAVMNQTADFNNVFEGATISTGAAAIIADIDTPVDAPTGTFIQNVIFHDEEETPAEVAREESTPEASKEEPPANAPVESAPVESVGEVTPVEVAPVITPETPIEDVAAKLEEVKVTPSTEVDGSVVTPPVVDATPIFSEVAHVDGAV